MKKQLETTYDLYRKAAAIAALARMVTNEQRLARLEVERKDVERIVKGAIETGYYTGEAQQELANANFLITVGFRQAVRERKEAERSASRKEFWASL